MCGEGGICRLLLFGDLGRFIALHCFFSGFASLFTTVDCVN